MKKHFQTLSQAVFNDLKEREHATVDLVAEDSQFLRLNHSKVRQIGTVKDSLFTIQLVKEGELKGLHRQASSSVTLTGDLAQDTKQVLGALSTLKSEIQDLSIDPFSELPKNNGSSESISKGKSLNIKDSVEKILPPIQSIDLAGLYAGGSMVRANANSKGQLHWFETDTFAFDYSLYTSKQKALKGLFAGKEWNQDSYVSEISDASEKIKALEKPSITIKKGAYRTFLGPHCFHELLPMFSWGAVSEAAIRQGDSPLIQVRNGKSKFSPLFNLTEDFTRGEVPRFNDKGEVAPEKLSVLENGELKNTLISARTALEYGLLSNAASTSEGLRAPCIGAGTLKSSDVLKSLGTGLYLSNLHYLNWSDRLHGRITGMTRYACFWVEGGEIQAPIENLRFDDSIFNLFGAELEALTTEQRLIPATLTYGFRELGIMKVPGALVRKMEFTL